MRRRRRTRYGCGKSGLPAGGMLGLVLAFWQQVRWDAASGRADLHAWLDTRDFEDWCAWCGSDPAIVRQFLLGLCAGP
jgi:hypothetical protein